MNVTIVFVDNLELVVGQQASDEPNNEALLEWLENALDQGFMTVDEVRQYLADRGL